MHAIVGPPRLWLDWATGAAATAGLANAAWFIVNQCAARSPASRATCATLAARPEARLLGVPNSVLGLGYYCAVTAAAMLDAADVDGRAVEVVGWLSAAAFAASAYLAHALLFRLRARCTSCFVAHGINAVVLALFAVRAVLR